ncbi:KICSTOR complex protein SZT2-like isoform X2 [Coregonus clupeaformis]|uniref:KICSTOR complex protein SZT2-like isoform X2 n=1 Tax=Coregonus clupeaformis TaxID=59861 RepID=UPI001E1C785C|nr:KICSTOR complex protein SZT2-like isoform X2 [Coregonus clupeaformis]
MAERQDNEVEEADQVYLLMKEEYRISRNVRLAWFLGKLNQVIWPAPKSELLNSENELDLLSILPKGWQPDFSPSTMPYLLVPSTRVTFLARRYRFIIELDLSPSTGIVDDSTGEMIFDEVFHALSRCLAGLVRPFNVPGTDHVFQPEIFVTILAYSSIIGLNTHQVLVQGCQLDRTALDQFLHQIYQQLRSVENNTAEVLQQQHNHLQQQHDQSDGPIPCPGLGSDITMEEVPVRKHGVSMVTADVGLVSMVRQGILALQLLPPNSSAGIIIITDGVTSVPDVAVCETLLNQLRSGTIACSFVQVGGAYSYNCSFGYIPNVELMKFISLATFGSYLSSCPEPDLASQDMNTYHKAFLTYSFLKNSESMNPEYNCVSQHKLFNEHLVSASGNPALVMRRKKHTEKEVHAHLVSVVSVRLREGYTIREINLTKGGTQLEVKLVLLWKHNMRIEYLAVAQWPLDPAKRTTWVEVTMEGSYDILHDISCTMRKPITSTYRTSVIRRFWNTLQSINQTDQMLVHLQSFNSLPENYTIPESTKNGVPLFYIPPGSTTPVLSLQHSGSKDSSQSQFASYWKPILSMDANFWQRWLHMHRIAIILEHDMPVPKHLHTAGSNGRFSTIQCRISHSALTSLLRDWSSFVLVEGYSYVKLIYSASDQPPNSFYLVRLISKAPCMVLRLGFPIGTLAHTRNKIVDELREQILRLRFPHRVQNKEATPKTKRKILGHASPSKSPPLPAPKPALSDRPCVVVLNKPLEKLLIRYEKLPSDFRTPFILNMENFTQPINMTVPLSMAANRTASSTLASLSRYFLHQRWVWTVQNGLGSTVPLQAVAHILSMLSEIRLSEGFHFASSGEGIVNMVTELPMKGMPEAVDRESHTCIVQYILFPPHSTSTKDSFSTDDDNETEVEAIDVDTELNLVTECWVEPQSGTVWSPRDQHRHFQELTYQGIPQAIFPRDLTCMSTMMTFEYLSQLCQNKEQVYPPSGPAAGEPPASEDCIHTVPFQFDLIELLPKCQQIEIFFLTLSRVENEEVSQSTPYIPNELLLSLFHSSLQQELSDREIPLADQDNVTFMHHILDRERDGHVAPFSLPVIREECLKPPERQDTVMSFHTTGSSKEVTGSTSTLQSFSNADLVDEEAVPVERDGSTPQWKCYAKYISPQQILLTFLPSTFTDVQMLMSSGLETEPQDNGDDDDTLTTSNKSQADSHSGSTNGLSPGGGGPAGPRSPLLSPGSGSSTVEQDNWESRPSEPENGTKGAGVEERDGVQFAEPQKRDFHITFSRQASQQSSGDLSRPRCPVYVYNCSLDSLKDQLLNPHSNRQPRDIFFRSLSQERSSTSSWTDLMSQPHKNKELANYCSLLQEHYHQCYVKGVYHSLQQSHSISSQDLLTAMDYCEESLQEIDITSFLQTLCGHIRVFRERHGDGGVRGHSSNSATFTVGEAEEDGPVKRGPMASSSSIEMEDVSEAESRGKASAPNSPRGLDEPPRTTRIPEFPLSLLHLQQKCEVYPDLHKIIQDKFMEIGAQYFKTVPSNPHYFYYCPPSSKKEDSDREEERRLSEEVVSEAEPATEDENMSGCCIMMESDTDLEVEYQERAGGRSCIGTDGEGEAGGEGEDESLSDSNTVNQDEDSFSILEGDSLLEPEGPQPEMPPLFVHLTCSVNMKSCHGSMPITTLPTCLGEVITCLENAEALQAVDLNDLSVTLDIFVLTLPLEIEGMQSDLRHNRYTSESSVSLNRSPGQPSSYRSDEELMGNLDSLRGVGVDGVGGDPLAKLPTPHKLAVLATMDEIRWLLEDEIVSALRLSRVIRSSTLQKVADHVFRSGGRPRCHCEVVPLQFVFGPEQSLEKFKEEFRRMSFSGYLLNGEQDNFHYMSLSRLHPKRIQAAKRLSESTVNPGEAGENSMIGRNSQLTNHLPDVDDSARAPSNHGTPGRRPDHEAEVARVETDSEVQGEEKKSTVGAVSESVSYPAQDPSDPPVKPTRADSEEGPRPRLSSVGATSTPAGDSTRLSSVGASTSRPQLSSVGRGGEEIRPRLSSVGSNSTSTATGDSVQASTLQLQPSTSTDRSSEYTSPPKTPSTVSLAESVQSTTHSSGKLRPSRVQSVVSSQGSLDSDMLGYDGGSSDSECESPTVDEQESQSPLMPDFWLIVKIHQDRVEVYSQSRSFNEAKEGRVEEEEEEEEVPEYLRLHQMVVRKIGEICRIVNQRLLLQDLHDSHVCNSLLVAESEEDIWKNESLYRQRLANSDDYNAEESYQPRDYLAATMQFIPGHFACEVVWSTVIHIHPRLKMGPNMGVSRAIQALRSVLNAMCVVNRKSMFVYQERTTKSVFYLRLSETSQTGKYSDQDGNLHPMSRCVGLAQSQEPLYSEDLTGSRSSLEGARPVGQVDKHILLLVHGVGSAGPEITDELVKVLRKRLDETTLDIITIMLGRNCKLTPADVEFIQPSGSPATEVMEFTLPQCFMPWTLAVAHYLRQNLLIFLHIPKYTDSYVEHHFKHYFHQSNELPDSDIYLYNKPGGQGTGGKGIACIALSFVDAQGCPLQVPAQDCATPPRGDASTILLQPDQFDALTTVIKVDSNNLSSGPEMRVRFDIWEQGNVSPLQLTDKLRGALRHALCDVIMELRVLPNPLCLETFCATPGRGRREDSTNSLLSPPPLEAKVNELEVREVKEVKEFKDSFRPCSGSRRVKNSPSPITLIPAPPGTTPNTGPSTPESTTPTGKTTRRSFWEILSKPDSSELGSPKTTDDIVQEKGEEGRTRRRHKTENVKQQWSQEKAMAVELEQAQRRHVSQLEEGDVGTLHPLYQVTCQPWITFMAKLGCPSIQQCTAEIASQFLLPPILTEIVNLVSSLACDTAVKVFERTSCLQRDIFVPLTLIHHLSQPPTTSRTFILIGRNFHQWHCSTEQEDSSDDENTPEISRFTPHKGFQRFEALEQSDWFSPGQASRGVAPRQRFLLIHILDKKVTLYTYNWSVDLGVSLNRGLVRLVQWQNARSHVIHCLLNQKMGLFHHYCFSDTPAHEDLKQEPNPFLNPTMEADALLRSPVPPVPSKDQGRLASSIRSLAPLHFPSELVPFDEALRDIGTGRPLASAQDGADVVARHGAQLLEVKAAERREMEKQMKIENLFVTWQQRSAQSNMPISVVDLDTLKQSSRLVHYCATPLLFDPVFRKQIQEEQIVQPQQVKKRHCSSDSTASGRDRSYSTDSADMLPSRLREEPWLQDISNTFLQQYVQYLQSMGFILVQVRPQSPGRSTARARAAMLSSLSSERQSFSYNKARSEDSPKSTGSGTTAYHLQRALPGGIVLMELAFQGCYFCVKQYALECSRIPMGQTVNSQGSLLTKPLRLKPFPDATPVSDSALSMLFTEECDKVRDLMHVHSFSYDFHLRVVHQYLVGCHMTLRQGYQLTGFLEDFIAHHPDIPKFGRNHVFQGSFSISTGMITAHQLYNYITDHAGTYGMKPLRMSKVAMTSEGKKGAPPSSDLHEYALVALWNSSGSYKDLEGLRHHDDFDVSLLVCHNAAPFEEQSEGERHLLRLRYYVIMTSQRELFPRLTADMRRFKKLPQIHREARDLGGRVPLERGTEPGGARDPDPDLWEETPAATSAPDTAISIPSDGNEFYPLTGPRRSGSGAQGLLYPSPLFPLLNQEVGCARRQIQASVEQAMGHCRRDNLWRRLFHGEHHHLAMDKLKLSKLSFSELEELLNAVQSQSVGEIDPQLDCFLTMSPSWYQSLIKVLLTRFPQSCRHFDDSGIQYLAVLNQKFTDCFVLVFLDTKAGKTSLKVVFREPLPSQPQPSSSPPPQLVSMYHHLESVINTACYNLWTGLL